MCKPAIKTTIVSLGQDKSEYYKHELLVNGREGVKKEGSEKKEDSQKRRKRKISKHLGK